MKISGQTIVVTGGSRGLGAGIVEVLAQRGARVCVVARSASHQPFATAQGKVVSITGDIRDKILARQIIKDYQPTAIILNAGAIPPTTPIDVIDWDVFSQPWETDVRGALVWMQASLAAPLPYGSAVISVASGAALNGSPLSGGYAGAKRMLWLMGNYARILSNERNLGIRFQAVLPLQMVACTGVGDTAASAYASRLGIDSISFLARFGRPLTPLTFGEYVADVLESETEHQVRAYGIKGDIGVTQLEVDPA